MPKEHRTPLFSYKTLQKYCSLNVLRKRRFCNLHMSGCQSPNLPRSVRMRRRVNPAMLMETDNVVPSVHDESSDYVVFPSPISVSSEQQQNNKAGDECWNRNVTARRPLHQPVDPHTSLRRSPSSKVTPSPRKSAAPYQLSKNRKLSDEEDSVKFLGEIKKSTVIPNLEDSPSRSKIIIRTSSDLRVPKECDSLKKRSPARLRITLKQRTSNSSEHQRIPRSPPTHNNDTITIDAEDEPFVKTSTHRSDFKTNSPVEERNNIIDISLEHDGDDDDDDDDDLVIVSTDNDRAERMDFQSLKRIVISVVSHFLEENDPIDLSTHYVLGRLKSLYHRDFRSRVTEIERCMTRALSRCQSSGLVQSCQEVRPGIRHLDIDTLSLDNWVNDIIINQYMSILVKDQPGYAALSSFWYEELQRGKEPVLPRGWEKLRQILVPTCILSHWSLLSYIPDKGRVEIYSSMPVTEAEIYCAKMLLDFFKRKTSKCSERWTVMENLPHQKNENDCGVYVCMFARCIICGNSFDIAPEQVIEFRDWLKNEIIKERLFSAKHEFVE